MIAVELLVAQAAKHMPMNFLATHLQEWWRR
jgi:hypothetical protein